MNGAADLGGMMGFGPVVPEPEDERFHAEWERRILALVLAMGAAACTPAAQNDADAAGEKTEAAAADAGSAIKEEAGQVGSAIAAGAKEAAQEVDEATDTLAAKADEQKAETAADHTGNAPAGTPAH